MERSYYFSIHDQSVGPLDAEAIRLQLQQGAITAQTLAWCEGMPDWQPAAQIDELTEAFSELQSQAQPPPLPGIHKAQPPPLPGEKDKAQGSPGTGSGEGATPAGLSSIEASAYRFVLGIFRSWGGRSSPVRNYVLHNPKRAVPVAVATIAVMAMLLFSLPALFETPSESPADTRQQVQQGGLPAPPPNWQQGYQAWKDAHNYNQGVIDDVYKSSIKSGNRMDDTYRCGTYGMCGNNN